MSNTHDIPCQGGCGKLRSVLSSDSPKDWLCNDCRTKHTHYIAMNCGAELDGTENPADFCDSDNEQSIPLGDNMPHNFVECPRCLGDREEPGAPIDLENGTALCMICNGAGEVEQKVADQYHLLDPWNTGCQ